MGQDRLPSLPHVPTRMSDMIATPPTLPGPRVPLSRVPLRETNPVLAQLRDFVAGLTGFADPLEPDATVATGIGSIGSVLPLGALVGGLQKVGKAGKAAAGAKGAGSDVVEAVTHGSSAPAIVSSEMPAARGSLADTLQRDKSGIYSLKGDVQERMHKFYRLGAGVPSNWEGSNEELIAAFGGDAEAARQWARMWGATSPNTSVPRNTAESISAHLWKLEHPGEEMTADMARALNPNITMAGSKVPNINRAVRGEPLSGDKVEAMAGFMVGEPRTPIDVHVLYGIGSKADNVGQETPALRALMTTLEKLPPRGSLTDTQIYLKYEDALRRSLQEFDPQRPYNPLFAQTWEGIRAGKGLGHQGGPIDILRAKGLLEPGAMLDPKRLKDALQSKGWTAPAVTALLSAIYLGGPATDAAAAPSMTPATSGPAPGSRNAGM